MSTVKSKISFAFSMVSPTLIKKIATSAWCISRLLHTVCRKLVLNYKARQRPRGKMNQDKVSYHATRVSNALLVAEALRVFIHLSAPGEEKQLAEAFGGWWWERCALRSEELFQSMCQHGSWRSSMVTNARPPFGSNSWRDVTLTLCHAHQTRRKTPFGFQKYLWISLESFERLVKKK